MPFSRKIGTSSSLTPRDQNEALLMRLMMYRVGKQTAELGLVDAKRIREFM